MPRPSDNNELTLFSKPPLLITELEEDFASLSAALEQEIKPRGTIERMYVAEIAYLVWEILRLRRCKVVIINTAFKHALERLLDRLIGHVNSDGTEGEERAALVNDWISEPHTKGEVSELLGEYHLDESAIEAEAFRRRAADLERLDRSLALAEVRRDKALRCIAEHRQNLAKHLQQATDRILDDDDVPRLVAVGKRSD